MKYLCVLALGLSLCFGSLAYSQTVESPGKSEWVFLGPDNRLEYKTTEKGDRILDFSHAGFMGGGVPLPDVPVKQTVSPAPEGEDCTVTIQEAINAVSALPPNEKGFRGAVLLAPGDFPCNRTLTISADGVVLRGSVSPEGKLESVIRISGPKHTAIRVSNQATRQRPASPSGNTANIETSLAEPYVAAGTRTFRVKNVEGFEVGDRIEIVRPVTKEWVHFMEMDDLVRDGKPQTWISTNTRHVSERTITGIKDESITVDVPLADSYDAKFLDPPGTTVRKPRQLPHRLRLAGIESLRLVSPDQAVNHTAALYDAVRLNGEDCWMRNVRIEETMNSVGIGGRRITLQSVDVIRKARHEGSSKPAEFAPNAGQVLLDRCSVEGDNIWFAATGGGISGPIVLLNCNFKGNGRIEGHQRWTTGILLDNCVLPDGGIDFKNRGAMGSGHGWGSAWSVAWNCEAKDFVIQQPPGTHNWAIGCIGRRTLPARPFDSSPKLPEGTIDSHGTHVAPKSLYLKQLQDRLGTEALKNIGY